MCSDMKPLVFKSTRTISLSHISCFFIHLDRYHISNEINTFDQTKTHSDLVSGNFINDARTNNVPL